MKKILLILFLLSSSAFAYPKCSRELSSALQTVYRFPEARKLIKEVEAQGAICIYRAPFNSHAHAMWIPTQRAICINSNKALSFGAIVRSIFFELHNAKSQPLFTRVDWEAKNLQISRYQYVESIEWIEYQNAYQTSHLIEKAIQEGYFPHDTTWPIPHDFQTHFATQKRCGHSRNIAVIYEKLTHSRSYGSLQNQQAQTR